MKTPDEIKKSLKTAINGCMLSCGSCNEECSYAYYCGPVNVFQHATAIPKIMVDDALALIEQLESHSTKWTSVAEHLPQKPGKYLVYSKVGTMYTSKFDPDIHKRWPHFGKVSVTHWMPRPEEPKEE